MPAMLLSVFIPILHVPPTTEVKQLVKCKMVIYALNTIAYSV